MLFRSELEVDKSDIRFVNGSTTRGIDFVRELENFISTMPFGEFRYVIIDEFDGFTHDAQAGLRSMMEEYSNIARFILTANYAHKIIPAIKSRCQTFEIQSLDRAQYMERIAKILMQEGIDLTEENLEILDDYVSAAYPDLRKCINLLQQNCVNGNLRIPDNTTSSGTSDYVVQAIALFKRSEEHTSELQSH